MPKLPVRLVALASLAALSSLAACGDGGGGPSEGDQPRITSIAPNEVLPNSGRVLLFVRGNDFGTGATIEWNGTAQETDEFPDGRLFSSIPGTEVVNPGTAAITVVTADGRRSPPVTLLITENAAAFQIDTIAPLQVLEASPGHPITIYFSEAVDPASVTAANFQVRTNGTPVPLELTYDALRRAIVLVGDWQPLGEYELFVSDAVRTPGGAGLGVPRIVPFSVAAGPFAALGGGAYPSLAFTTDGALRVSFQGGGGQLRLASCGSACDVFDSWTVQILASGPGMGEYTSLVRGPSGELRLAYATPSGVEYRRIGSGAVAIDPEAGRGNDPSLVVAPFGRTHIVYYRGTTNEGPGEFRHAWCDGTCGTVGDWTNALIDAAEAPGLTPSAALDADDGVHVVYSTHLSRDLMYAYCPGPCDGTGWTTATLSESGNIGWGAALAIGSDGRLHATVMDLDRYAVVYATCAAECALAENWTLSDLDQFGPGNHLAHTAMAIGPSGTVEVVYHDTQTGWLRTATCAAGCSGGMWVTSGISRQHPEAGYALAPALGIDAAGTRHVVWTGRDARMMYMRY
jgi:hypothetical protein